MDPIESWTGSRKASKNKVMICEKSGQPVLDEKALARALFDWSRLEVEDKSTAWRYRMPERVNGELGDFEGACS